MSEAHTTNYWEAPEPFDPPLTMFKKAMVTIKEAVRIEDYASELTDLFRSTESLRGICPIHGGENRSSFAVYPDRGRWYCFRCDEGGDVLDLCQRVEGHPQLWTAMVSLAQRYNVELPTRPESWHCRQGEKAEFRKALCRRLTERRVRRYYRVFAPTVLGDAIDEEDRKERSEDLWDSLWAVLYPSTKARLEGEHGR